MSPPPSLAKPVLHLARSPPSLPAVYDYRDFCRAIVLSWTPMIRSLYVDVIATDARRTVFGGVVIVSWFSACLSAVSCALPGPQPACLVTISSHHSTSFYSQHAPKPPHLLRRLCQGPTCAILQRASLATAPRIYPIDATQKPKEAFSRTSSPSFAKPNAAFTALLYAKSPFFPCCLSSLRFPAACALSHADFFHTTVHLCLLLNAIHKYLQRAHRTPCSATNSCSETIAPPCLSDEPECLLRARAAEENAPCLALQALIVHVIRSMAGDNLSNDSSVFSLALIPDEPLVLIFTRPEIGGRSPERAHCLCLGQFSSLPALSDMYRRCRSKKLNTGTLPAASPGSAKCYVDKSQELYLPIAPTLFAASPSPAPVLSAPTPQT